MTPEAAGMLPSHFNPSKSVWNGDTRQLRFADCTLRDGEQQAGVVLRKESKIEIARRLDELGVFEIEAGTVASSGEDRLAIQTIVAQRLKAKVSVLCRALEKDIDDAVALGVWGVRLSFPISQIERKNKLKGIGDAEYIERAVNLSRYARDKGLKVIFSPYDTSRADPDFLPIVAHHLEKDAGVTRIRIVDTTGCALPEAIRMIVGLVRGAAPATPLEIHCHNDFGLACANTLAGIAAGADYISSTINGLGERSGNAATEEVAMALEVLWGYRTGLRLDQFLSISQRVAQLTGSPVQNNKAVVGANAFRHEAGMVVAGVLRDPYTAEAYRPELVGQVREIVIGKKSGLMSVTYKLQEMGLSLPKEEQESLLDDVKHLALEKGRALSNEEFKTLAERYLLGQSSLLRPEERQ